MTAPATAPPALAEAPTLVLRPVRPLPPKLQTLLDVHLLVTSRRWQERRAAPSGAWFSDAPGVIYRVRTEQIIPVPPLERTPR